MTLLPIAAREAREISRRARGYHLRWIFGLIGFSAIGFALWVARYDQLKGGSVFLALSAVAQLYCLLAGVITASDTISSERREGTLGLLFLTDLKPKDVLLGKLITSSTYVFFGLLAILPLLMMPLLLGGVTLNDYLLVAAALINTLFLSISVAFLASAIFSSGWAATTASLTAMISLGIVWPLMAAWFDWSMFAFASPTYALLVLLETPLDRTSYLQSIAFSHLTAWLSLAVVAVRLVYLWKDRPRTRSQQKRFEFLNALRFGSRRARAHLRRKLLDQNPLSWLANREQVSSSGLLIFVTAVSLVFLLSMLLTADWRFNDVVFFGFLGLLLTQLVLFMRICIAAAYQMAEERKSGALELLLSTPLSVPEIIRGRRLALRRQFFGPVLVLAVMHLAFVMGFSFLDEANLKSFFQSAINLSMGEDQFFFGIFVLIGLVFALNWIAGGWLGMWLGLRCKSSAAAVWITFCIVLVAPWLLYFGCFIGVVMLGLDNLFEDSNIMESLFLHAAFLLALSYAGALIFFSRRNLAKRFRESAADRFRNQRWRFPWRRFWRYSWRFGATAIILLGIGAFWHGKVNRRGELIWQQALAEHPHFVPEEVVTFKTQTIPPEQNLAEGKLFGRLPMYFAGAQNRYLGATLEISRIRLPQWFARATPSQPYERPWTRGELMPLKGYVDSAVKMRALTNVAQPPEREILNSFTRAEPVIEKLIAEAKERPHTQFRYYHPHFYQLCSAISLHAIARMRLGEAAHDEVILIMRIIEGLQDTPTPSVLPLLNVAFQAAFEGLALHRWNDAQLRDVQDSFGKFDIWAFRHESVDRTVRESLASLDSYASGRNYEPYHRILGLIRPRGWALEEKANLIRLAFETLPGLVDTNGPRINLQRVVAFQSTPMSDVQAMHLRAYGMQMIELLSQKAQAQTTVSQIKTACALERYRLQHGRFPTALNDLSPTFLEKPPTDLLNGESMKYRPAEDFQSYRLYSVAWDGRDNLGITPAECADTAGCKSDWVWLMPAKRPL